MPLSFIIFPSMRPPPLPPLRPPPRSPPPSSLRRPYPSLLPLPPPPTHCSGGSATERVCRPRRLSSSARCRDAPRTGRIQAVGVFLEETGMGGTRGGHALVPLHRGLHRAAPPGGRHRAPGKPAFRGGRAAGGPRRGGRRQGELRGRGRVRVARGGGPTALLAPRSSLLCAGAPLLTVEAMAWRRWRRRAAPSFLPPPPPPPSSLRRTELVPSPSSRTLLHNSHAAAAAAASPAGASARLAAPPSSDAASSEQAPPSSGAASFEQRRQAAAEP